MMVPLLLNSTTQLDLGQRPLKALVLMIKREFNGTSKFGEVSLSGYLYGLGWTLGLACQTLYAFVFPNWVGFPLGGRMSGGIRPVEHVYRADIDTDSISFT